MKSWAIRSATLYDTPVLGTYDAASERGALDALAREAGREDYVAFCLVYGYDPDAWAERYIVEPH